ncbi:heparinase II/III domain-containing protein [Radicibacter daui]|uniref:heparinase II/III domain-containing protein n=1 Tax=Radicibacter daui TaxID=3064829 RepID=UPI004046ADD5
MFADQMKIERLLEGAKAGAGWKPFPDISERARWGKAAADSRLALSVEAILAYADALQGTEIDPLTGSMYMDFITNGDRIAYEENYFRRRYEFSHLVIAECLTAKGTYLTRIIDYFWALLGEVSWCVPAHNFAGQHEMVMFKNPNPWKADDPLPVPGDDYLDLFTCETAALLAEACYLLRPLLLERVPSLYYRIHQEVTRRALAVLEGPKAFGWYLGRNNWTAWCAHNLLQAACYVVEDPARLAAIAMKLVAPMQRFFDTIEESGSCIEGPSYWVVSAGRLAAFIDLVEDRFQLDLGFARNAKFRNFGDHILPLHIAGNRFVNFADGSSRIDLDHGVLSRYATRIGSAALAGMIWDDVDRVARRKLAREVRTRGHNEYARHFLVHLTRLLFWTPEMTSPGARHYGKSVWLADMQMMIARESDKAGAGLMVSAIAGSNDPHINHHSHNDIGQFGVYLDGEPLIIDLGQGAYSKSTFTETRYDMWHISSTGHNVPQINGLLQRAGVGAEARSVRFGRDGSRSILRLDASPAYLTEPGECRMERTIGFDHHAAVLDIRDEIDLKVPLSQFILPLHVADRPVTVRPDGSCLIEGTSGILVISPHNLVVAEVEVIAITDPRHLEAWGPQIKRIRFEGKEPASGTFGLTIRKE